MNKIINKGGRPELSPSEKKKYKITTKMITEEYFSLMAKVDEANTSISEFVRECLRNGYVKEKMSEEDMDIIRKLSGMANNLNQIAKKANSVGYIQTHQECMELINKIIELKKQLSK